MSYPHLLRSRSSPFRMRDPGSGEMKNVGPRLWVEFEVLPRGMSPEGDGEVSVKTPVCPEDMAAVKAENDRMAAEDVKVAERLKERREQRAAEKARKENEAAAALAAQQPEGWKPPDPDGDRLAAERERLIALGRKPPEDDPRLLDAEGNALTLEAFVEKHDGMLKDEIVAWAEKLGLDTDGTKAEILGVIYASVPAG